MGADSTPRRRLPGVSVRAGAVREARQSAGLSLAQVAGSDLTRAAIHLVETGRARPSMPTLELIARRTGRPVSFFLEGGAGAPDVRRPVVAGGDLTRAERLSSGGQYAEAARFAEGLIREGMNPWSEARLRLLIGQCRVRLAEHAAASRHLARALELFRGLGDGWEAAECMYWISGSMYVQEDPGALEVAEEAIRTCTGLEPRPEATIARILCHVGAIRVSRREWRAALAAYESAREAAGNLRDLHQVARTYEGLSAVYGELGDLDRASHYAERVLALNALERDRLLIARTENNLGLALLRQGRIGEAEAHIHSALAYFDTEVTQRGRENVLLSLAEAHLARGALADSRHVADEAVALAAERGAKMTLGMAHQVLGRVAAASGEEGVADSEFETAIAILTELDVPDRLAECRSIYADILAGRGDAAGAYRQLREAIGRSRPELHREDRLREFAELA